jgi:4-diphosphocytidyl-2C-methyl-D-erythritol kinase
MRADGYHDLATVFQSISLADSLIVTPKRRGFTLRIRHEDASVRRGLKIAADHNVVDGTQAGLLAERAELGAQVLALLAEEE